MRLRINHTNMQVFLFAWWFYFCVDATIMTFHVVSHWLQLFHKFLFITTSSTAIFHIPISPSHILCKSFAIYISLKFLLLSVNCFFFLLMLCFPIFNIITFILSLKNSLYGVLEFQISLV